MGAQQALLGADVPHVTAVLPGASFWLLWHGKRAWLGSGSLQNNCSRYLLCAGETSSGWQSFQLISMRFSLQFRVFLELFGLRASCSVEEGLILHCHEDVAAGIKTVRNSWFFS